MTTKIATRAKFGVWNVTRNINSQGEVTSETVTYGAVTGAEGSENRSFWNATPSAQLTMTITNPTMFDAFRPRQSYYVDFTQAE